MSKQLNWNQSQAVREELYDSFVHFNCLSCVNLLECFTNLTLFLLSFTQMLVNPSHLAIKFEPNEYISCCLVFLSENEKVSMIRKKKKL